MKWAALLLLLAGVLACYNPSSLWLNYSYARELTAPEGWASFTVDTQELVNAGKLRSDCKDLRVVNATETLTFTRGTCPSESTQISYLSSGSRAYLIYGNPSETEDASSPPLTDENVEENGSTSYDTPDAYHAVQYFTTKAPVRITKVWFYSNSSPWDTLTYTLHVDVDGEEVYSKDFTVSAGVNEVDVNTPVIQKNASVKIYFTCSVCASIYATDSPSSWSGSLAEKDTSHSASYFTACTSGSCPVVQLTPDLEDVNATVGEEKRIYHYSLSLKQEEDGSDVNVSDYDALLFTFFCGDTTAQASPSSSALSFSSFYPEIYSVLQVTKGSVNYIRQKVLEAGEEEVYVVDPSATQLALASFTVSDRTGRFPDPALHVYDLEGREILSAKKEATGRIPAYLIDNKMYTLAVSNGEETKSFGLFTASPGSYTLTIADQGEVSVTPTFLDLNLAIDVNAEERSVWVYVSHEDMTHSVVEIKADGNTVFYSEGDGSEASYTYEATNTDANDFQILLTVTVNGKDYTISRWVSFSSEVPLPIAAEVKPVLVLALAVGSLLIFGALHSKWGIVLAIIVTALAYVWGWVSFAWQVFIAMAAIVLISGAVAGGERET